MYNNHLCLSLRLSTYLSSLGMYYFFTLICLFNEALITTFIIVDRKPIIYVDTRYVFAHSSMCNVCEQAYQRDTRSTLFLHNILCHKNTEVLVITIYIFFFISRSESIKNILYLVIMFFITFYSGVQNSIENCICMV